MEFYIGAVLCECVYLCEAGWLTWVFTLCPFSHTVSEQTNNKKKLFQTNFSMKHLLTYQLLLQVRILFILQLICWCFAVVFLFDNTLFYHYTLNIYIQYIEQATCSVEEHAVNHNRFCSCANTDKTAAHSLHPPQLANAPALCCQRKIPLRIHHTAKSYGGQRVETASAN